MFSKKQMNINSIFDGNFNSSTTDCPFDADYYKSCRGSSFADEKNLSMQNYFIQSALEKSIKFDRYSENFSDNYCICNPQLQEYQKIESINQLIISNFCICSEEAFKNESLASNWLKLSASSHVPSIYQDSEIYKQFDSNSGRFAIESKLKQCSYSEIENLNMMKSREIVQNNSNFQPQIPLVGERRVFSRRHVLGSKITKRNMKYFEELQNYNYLLETKVDAETGKQFTVYVCNHPCGCRKEFERPWNLLDHIRIHYDVRPYTCSYCNLKFIQKGNLNKHMMIHLKNSQENSLNNMSPTDPLNVIVRNIRICISNVII